MVPPLLKLVFVQGPRDGDSLEYKPGSAIRIGRVVRGNEIAIKDAGISTKHLRIVSDSENWIIHDLGSSNGTTLNSDALDPDTPVNLRHGDVIKLGEYTSIVVNFETAVQAQEHNLPPKPRRNTRRRAVPDPDPIESAQEKPKRKGRPPKQDEHEQPKKKRAARSKTLEEIAENEKELEVESEKEVNPRVSRSLKNEKEKEVPVEKKGNSRARRGKNTECIQNLGSKSIKLETEVTPKGVKISAKKRATRSKQNENACLGFENVKSEDAVLDEKDEKITSRATRSRKKEIGGDSFMELEMVLKKARKGRTNKKETEQKPPKSVEMEARYDDVEEDKEGEMDVDCSERSETSKRIEQVEIELRKSTSGEEGLNCTIREDVCTEIDEERDCPSEEEAGTETPDGGCEQVSSNNNVEKVEVDLGKMSLGEWLGFMEVHLRKHIVEETEKLIEPIRSKTQRVHKYIAEQEGKRS